MKTPMIIGGVGPGGAEVQNESLPQPARKTEPRENGRLPLRETRTELGGQPGDAWFALSVIQE